MNHYDDNSPVFYVPGRLGLIDLAVERNGQLTGAYSGETLDQIRARYPGAEIGKLGPVAEQTENAFKSGPEEITEERFVEMLGVLPPVQWTNRDGCESFKLSERTSGSITAIFCRIGGRYFTLSDSIATPHADIVARCRAFAGKG